MSITTQKPTTMFPVSFSFTSDHSEDYLGIPQNNEESPILRMYGVTENGHSVMVHIHNFLPYFYVQLQD